MKSQCMEEATELEGRVTSQQSDKLLRLWAVQSWAYVVLE